MIIMEFRLRCDGCGKEYNGIHDTIRNLIKYSKKVGWIEKEVPIGSTLAFCPKCIELKKHEDSKK